MKRRDDLRPSPGRDGAVSATELAEMGFCEKRVLLAHLHGENATPEQCRARARGQVAHQRYYEDGMASISDRRCFVASCVWGPDAEETRVLRSYRDAVLLRSRWGTWLVAMYYRLSPAACRILERWPMAAAGVRWMLRIVVARCRRVIGAIAGD